MSTDEMRMAAAVGSGWKNVHWYEDNSGPPILSGVPFLTAEEILALPEGMAEDIRKFGREVPDYANDLNATAKLAATLSSVEFLEGPFYLSEQAKFNSELERIVDRDLAGTKQEKFYFDIINATAIQRCEAYLITKGLWIVKE